MASAADFLEWARTKQAQGQATVAAPVAAPPPAAPVPTEAPKLSAPVLTSSASSLPPIAAPTANNTVVVLAPEVAIPAAEKEREILMSQIQTLLEERNRLKLQVQDVVAPTPEFAINQMLLRAPFNLQPFRSLEDKRKLLHLAALSYDQNCVLSVVLSLRDTLGGQLFLQELGREPIASAMYISYLKESNDVAALQALYRAQGRYKQEAALMIQQAYRERRAEVRLEMLKQCIVALQGREELAFYKSNLAEQINLLERQILIEQTDTAEVPRPDTVMARVPRFSVLFTPVSTTTYYCLLYHNLAPKGRIAAPVNLQSTFGIPERRMMWLTLRARARINDWAAIKNLTAATGFFSSAPTSSIGFEPFVEVLSQTGAPVEHIAYYTGLVEPPERRFAIAEKYRVPLQHQVALDVLIALRQRGRALKYLAKLRDINAPEHVALERALADASLKWTP